MVRVILGSWGYTIGLCLICVGFNLFVVGFASPYWTKTAYNGAEVSVGLWKLCYESAESGRVCEDITLQTVLVDFGLFKVARIMLSTSLAFYILVVGFIFLDNATNTTKDLPNWKYCSVVLGFIAGLLGVGGTLLFGVKFYHLSSTASAILSWAFGLTAAGSCLALIGALVLLVSPLHHRGERTAETKRILLGSSPVYKPICRKPTLSSKEQTPSPWGPPLHSYVTNTHSYIPVNDKYGFNTLSIPDDPFKDKASA